MEQQNRHKLLSRLLYNAINEKSLTNLETLVKNSNVEDINQYNEESFPLLIHAINNGNLEIVKFLITKGINVNQTSPNGSSALLWAMNKGDDRILHYLLDNGADVTLSNNNGDTIFLGACIAGNNDLVKLLLSKGADLNKANLHGTTGLMCAARNGRLDTINLLLDHGADFLARNKEGKTAFQVASTAECKAVLEAKWQDYEKSKLGHINEHTTDSTKPKKRLVPTKNTNSMEMSSTQQIVTESHSKETELKSDTQGAQTAHPQDSPKEDLSFSVWTVVERKKNVFKPPVNPQKKVVQSKSNINQNVPSSPQKAVPTDTATTIQDAELQVLQDALHHSHEYARDLDLTLRSYLGLELDNMSMEQLTALEQIHFYAIQKLNDSKIELMRKQERQKLEEEMALLLALERQRMKTSIT